MGNCCWGRAMEGGCWVGPREGRGWREGVGAQREGPPWEGGRDGGRVAGCW